MNSYLLEVLATNRYQGQFILLNKTQDMAAMGLRPGSVRSTSRTPFATLKGFCVTVVPQTNSVIPGQQEVIDFFIRYPALFNLRYRAVIGEVLSGLYAGRRVALFGRSEIKTYFALSTLRDIANEGGIYLDTRWWYAQDVREAEPYYCQPDKQRILDVLRDHYRCGLRYERDDDDQVFRERAMRVAQSLLQWMKNGGVDHPEGMTELAGIYSALAHAIRCEAHHHWLLDTLYHFKAIIMYRNKPTDTLIRMLVASLLAAAQRVERRVPR